MKTVYIKRNALLRNIPMILCNNITTADESFLEDNFELFYDVCETCDGTGTVDTVGATEEDDLSERETKCEDCYGEGRHETEAYQYFIISANEWDLERFKEYGVNVGYSNALDVHVLPIYDYGTSWNAFSYSKEVEDDYELQRDETLERTTVY